MFSAPGLSGGCHLFSQTWSALLISIACLILPALEFVAVCTVLIIVIINKLIIVIFLIFKDVLTFAIYMDVRAGIIVSIFQIGKQRPKVKEVAQDHTATLVLR